MAGHGDSRLPAGYDAMAKKSRAQRANHDLAQRAALRELPAHLQHFQRMLIACASSEDDRLGPQLLTRYGNLASLRDAGDLALEDASGQLFRQREQDGAHIEDLFRQHIDRASHFLLL